VIHVSGTLAGQFGRRSTGQTSWDAAHRDAVALGSAGSWHGSVGVSSPEDAPIETGAERLSIADALSGFLQTRKAVVGYPTFRKYQAFTNQRQAFAVLGFFLAGGCASPGAPQR
jgi:hypothetical protein